MGNVLSDRKTWKGFAVLAIGSDNADNVRRINCSVEIENGAATDAGDGDAVNKIASGLGGADDSSEEAQCIAGETKPADRCSDGDRGRSWEETYKILSKVKQIWDDEYGRVGVHVCENKSQSRGDQAGSSGGVRSNSDGLLPLLSVVHDMCCGRYSDPLAIIVIHAEKPGPNAIRRCNPHRGGSDKPDECVPVHVAITLKANGTHHRVDGSDVSIKTKHRRRLRCM